ncbi:hypothetical protein Tco_1077782 [Tanacetum coccineum]
MGKIPMEEIKKELQAVELLNEAIQDLLQALSMKSLTELEDIRGPVEFKTLRNSCFKEVTLEVRDIILKPYLDVLL